MPNYDSSPFDADRLQRVNAILRGYVERGEVPGLVSYVSRQGEAHIETCGTKRDPIGKDSIFRIASLTKLVTAAATMILVEEGKLRLDDPVDSFLPELANRQVLKRIDGPLDETVPAHRAITTRDLLTMRLGLGHIMQRGEFPVMIAAQQMGILTGPPQPETQPGPDEWIRRVGTLPLVHQPGEQWMYDLGTDILGVLIARASGKPFDVFLTECIFEPLGMKDTGFYVPSDKLDRFTISYRYDGAKKAFAVYDPIKDSQWSKPPLFPSGSGGLVSTAVDFGAFCQMLLGGGTYKATRVLSRPSVELMTTNHLTDEQINANPIFFEGVRGWGFGMSVVTKRSDYPNIGSFGWTGGLGTIALVDPREQMVMVLMTQRAMDSPLAPKVFTDFIAASYQGTAE